jgi:hypothetical protein
MHSSDEQPETMKQAADETPGQQGLQPLYEFPPGGSLLNEAAQPAPITQILPEPGQEPQPEQKPAHGNAQQGFVYPPPPSYYQNMTLPPQHPIMPSPPQSRAGQQVPGGLNYAPQTPQRQMQQGGVHMYPPPGAPPFVSPPPVKKSYTWAWIVAIILAVAVLASCGLCGWGAYNLFNTSLQQVSGALTVVNDYYTNIQSQNYSSAYSDLAPQGQISGLTQDQFTTQAKQRDAQYGPVLSFVPGQPSFSNNPTTGPDLSRFTVTVDVKRTHLNYTVLLTVSKVRENWKIIEYDQV